MGSQLQLCTTVGSQLIEKCTKFWSPLVWPLQPLLMQNQATWDMGMDMGWEVSALELVSTPQDQSMSPDLPKDLASAVLSLTTLVMALLPMAMLLEVSAPELVSTPLDQSMSLGLPRVLARGALTLSLVITHRTTGLPLSLPMDTPHAMVVVVSAVLSQDILDMDMVSELSAEAWVFTQLGQSMNPDQLRVSVVDTCTRLILLLCIMLEINICQ